MPDSQDKIWSHFQNHDSDSFKDAKPRLDYILRTILRKRTAMFQKVLNIGAGDGYLEFRALKSGMTVFSLDPDAMTMQRLAARGVQSFQGYIEQMPFADCSFDFVIASEVLEHLNASQFTQGLNEVLRVMDHKAWFIGTVPYNENLSLNRVVCPQCGERFHRWGHQRAFNRHRMENELKAFFNTVLIRRMAFVSFKKANLPGIVKSFIRLVLGHCGSPIASPNIFFMAQKSEKP